MQIGIIGLGLIGGSLGLALRDMKLIDKIWGYDLSEQNAREAQELGLVDEICDFEYIKEHCDVIFLAIPVDAIVATLKRLEGVGAMTTIIDLGSTKAEIIASCPPSLRYNLIPAHPMRGTEFSGPKAAFRELLKGAVVVICDDKNIGESHVKRAVEIFSHVGMKIVFMDAASHDHHTALISHLPHVISFSLVSAVLSEENRVNIVNLAGGSFEGMARIAKSSPEMWLDIFKQNRQNLLNSIDEFEEQMAACRKMLENSDWAGLYQWMSEARKIREIL